MGSNTIRKEKRATSLRSFFINKPAEIVAPALEIPGMVAMAWAMPITKASRKGIFLFPAFTSWVEISRVAVTSSALPTRIRLPENSDSTFSR